MMDDINIAKREKEHIRAKALLDVHYGRLTIPELLEKSAHSDHEELLKIHLLQLLLAHPSIGEKTAKRVIQRMCEILVIVRPPYKQLTLSWLTDARTRGVRIIALYDAIWALAPHAEYFLPGGQPTLWNGFPFAPNPHPVPLPDFLERPSS